MHVPTFWCDGESSFCIVEFGVNLGNSTRPERPHGPMHRGAVNHHVCLPFCCGRKILYLMSGADKFKEQGVAYFARSVRAALAPRKWQQPCRKRTTQHDPPHPVSTHSPVTTPSPWQFCWGKRSIFTRSKTAAITEPDCAQVHLQCLRCKILFLPMTESLKRTTFIIFQAPSPAGVAEHLHWLKQRFLIASQS
jgi:hypothetical protein